MNIVCIPYHDWRKINKEGARTRDAHFIHHLSHSNDVAKTLIINRPTTYLEILLKKNPPIKGEVVLQEGGFVLYKVEDRLFVLDYITSDIIGQLLLKKKWFFKAFGLQKLHSFFSKSLEHLGIDSYEIICQNVFAHQFVTKNFEAKSVFDAWDNFLQFPDNRNIETELQEAYADLAGNATFWITNSVKNIAYFTEKFQVPKITLIKNGVDFELFQRQYPMPADMQNLSGAKIGFGGKISHLFDHELFNFCLNAHPDKNFVVVGQILNAEVFSKIEKRPNFHYLGDKHYSEYPAYVTNFDIGIIPYVNNHLDSGADSIKAYEYIAAGLNAIGSQGAGMKELSDYMFVADSPSNFASLITKALLHKQQNKLPKEHSWHCKTQALLDILK
ncbi:hypothetical protein L0663_15010 [Dyadobacter sp. CY107]|uniref:hypothetical protein n=1 Tax=Dyadobacter fanqingshengii TaxID=2906443 RepID=UPI001F1F8151|nr:hypothetical protein [Dyadobacter fanqingshengii]MCF2504701.1 hypothetical protein [Dyadobacter fanqingshengii]